MKIHELVHLNNQKREKLNKENKKYYEDMLLYIRTSLNKEEVQTEEVLSELLAHLLEAQDNGKSATEVFGDNPREYADEIIQELPKMNLKEKISFLKLPLSTFFITFLLFSGISDLIIYYSLHVGDLIKEIHIGSLTVKGILSIISVLILVDIFFKYMKWSIFRKIKKTLEFFFIWIGAMFVIGVFMAIFFLIPDFGPIIKIPSYVSLTVGGFLAIILYGKYIFNNK